MSTSIDAERTFDAISIHLSKKFSKLDKVSLSILLVHKIPNGKQLEFPLKLGTS